MTELQLQNYLYLERIARRDEPIVPNVYCFMWESDLISVTKAGLTHEFEIKVSRRDFKADLKKVEKHKQLETLKPCRAKGGKRWLLRIPNYFWYAVPPGLVRADEVPTYAGLIYADELSGVKTMKPAPLLHRERLSDRQLEALKRGLMFRYWTQRLKLVNLSK